MFKYGNTTNKHTIFMYPIYIGKRKTTTTKTLRAKGTESNVQGMFYEQNVPLGCAAGLSSWLYKSLFFSMGLVLGERGENRVYIRLD